MGQAMLRKSLIQFSLDGWSCVPSLLFAWGQTMVEVMKIMATSFKRSMHALPRSVPPASHRQPTPPLETPGHSQGSLGQSLVGSLLLSPGFWCIQHFVFALQESVSPGLWKFCNQITLASKVKFPGVSQSLCWIPRVRNLLCALELS